MARNQKSEKSGKSRRAGKWATLLLAASMAFSASVSVSAAEESEPKNNSQIDSAKVNIETDVYQVMMPTVSEGAFDFILDPQGLINETDGAMYEGQKFESDSTLFFHRTDGKTEDDYSNKSDEVTIINKSSMPVDIFLDVRVEPDSLGGIVMSEDKNFTDDMNPSLYLAVTDGEREIPVGKDGVSLHATVDAAFDGAYEYVYNSDKNEYVYRLKNNLESTVFDAYSFQLTGAANGKGDWTGLDSVSPQLTITWRVLPKENIVPRKDAVLTGQEMPDEESATAEEQSLNENEKTEEGPDKEVEKIEIGNEPNVGGNEESKETLKEDSDHKSD